MMGPDAQRSWKADPAQAAAGCGASRSSLTSSEGAVAVSRSRMRGEAAAARLQAVVRGYLIRKRLQSIRSKYESIVKEIEGDLDWVQWTGHFFPRPAFLSKSAKKSIKPFNREKIKIDKPQKQDAQYFQEISQSKQMCDFEMQFPSRLLAEVEPKEPKISEVGQQAVDAHSGNVCSLSGENEEGGEPSNASSDWSSTVLGMESPRMSQVFDPETQIGETSLRAHMRSFHTELEADTDPLPPERKQGAAGKVSAVLLLERPHPEVTIQIYKRNSKNWGLRKLFKAGRLFGIAVAEAPFVHFWWSNISFTSICKAMVASDQWAFFPCQLH